MQHGNVFPCLWCMKQNTRTAKDRLVLKGKTAVLSTEMTFRERRRITSLEQTPREKEVHLVTVEIRKGFGSIITDEYER